MANTNFKHTFDFEGLLNMKYDPQQWKELRKKLEEDFIELKIAVQDGMAEEEAQKVVDQFNKIFAKAKLPEIGIDDLRNDFDKLAVNVERAAAAINGFNVDALEDVLNELKLINGEVKKIVENKGGIKLFDEQNLKKIMGDIDRIAKSVAKTTSPFIKSIGEIDDAIGRAKVSAKDIQDAFDFTPGVKKAKIDKDIADIYAGYKASTSWEEEYTWLLKFNKAYEAYVNKLGKGEKPDVLYAELYGKHKGGSSDMRNMLQNILNRNEGKALVGYQKEPWALENTLQEIKNILQGGLNVNVEGGDKSQRDNGGKAQPQEFKGDKNLAQEKTLKNISSLLQKIYDTTGKGVYEKIETIAKEYNKAINSMPESKATDIKAVDALRDEYLEQFLSAFPSKDLDNGERRSEVRSAFKSFSKDLDLSKFQMRLRDIINNTLDKVLIDFSEDATTQLEDAFASGNQSSESKDIIKAEGDTVVIDPNVLADALGKMKVTADNKDVVAKLQKVEASLGTLVAQEETLKSLKDSLAQIQITPDNSEIVSELKTLAQNLGNLAKENTLQEIKNNSIRLTKEDIAQAVKEGVSAKDIAKKYRTAEFLDIFDYDYADLSQMINRMTGETLSETQAREKYKQLKGQYFLPKDKLDWFDLKADDFLSLDDAIKNIAADEAAEKNNWAQVIVEAITDQTGKITELVKLVLPPEISVEADDSKLVDAFRVLTEAINNFSGSTKYFFREIQGGNIPLSGGLGNALEALGLTSSSGSPKFKLASVGGLNEGVAIGSDIVYHSTPARQTGDLMALMEKQNRAYAAGAAVARIVAAEVRDNVAYQLQTKVAGQNLRQGDGGNFINASPEQIDRLLYTLEILEKEGLVAEFRGDNVMYDEKTGFSIIDLSSKEISNHAHDSTTADEMLREILDHGMDNWRLDSGELDKFRQEVLARAAIPAEQRLVNAQTIAAEQARAKAGVSSGLQIKTDNSDVVSAIQELGKALGTTVAQEDTLQAIKNEGLGLTKEDITLAIKEGVNAKAFDAKYRHLEMEDAFDNVAADEYVSRITGQVMNLSEALAEFKYTKDRYVVSKNIPVYQTTTSDILSVEDAVSDVLGNITPEQNNWAQVIVQAISDQTGQIVEIIKLLLPGEVAEEKKITDAFNALTQAISEWTRNNNERPKQFFEKILNGKLPLDDTVLGALRDLGMLSASGQPKFVMPNEGVRNHGVAIGSELVLPTRPKFLDQTDDLIPLLKTANQLGASVPRIIAAFNDGERVFELQTKMQGKNAKSDSSFINASDAQIDKLIHTMEVLAKVGLYPDLIGDNIMYDGQAGFSLVDLETENIDPFTPMDDVDDMVMAVARRLTSYDNELGLSPKQVQDFTDRVMARLNVPRDQRLVDEFGNIKETKESAMVDAQIIPMMEEGAVAKVVKENVEQTPAVVDITPVIDDESISNIVQRVQDELNARLPAMDIDSQNTSDAVNDAVSTSMAETAADIVEKSTTTVFDNLEDVADSQLDKVIQKRLVGPDGKTTAAIKKTEVSSEQTDNSFRTIKTHLKPGVDDDGKLTGEFIPEFVEIIDDLDKLRRAEKKDAKNVERAQKKVNEFLAKFKSKTGGNAQFIKGFNELEADVANPEFISKDNIDSVYNRMIELQREYAKLETNFRKGQSSLNPFVNAINKTQNIENIFGAVEIKFNGLVEKSEELTSQFGRLKELSGEIRVLTDKMNTDSANFSVADFENLSILMGEFTATKNQVDGLIKNEAKVNKAIVADQNAKVKEWVRLSKQLGVLQAKIESGLFDDVIVEQAKKEYDLVQKKIDALLSGINDPSAHLVPVGEANVAAENKIINTQMSQRIGVLTSKYEELGRLQARTEAAGANLERERYAQLKQEIEAEAEQIGLNQEENAGLLEILRTHQETAYASEKDLSIAKDRKQLFSEWIELVKQISALDVKINSGLFDNVTVENAKAARDVLSKQIDDIMPHLDLTREDYIFAGQESMKSEQETLLAQRQKLFKALAGDYEELGKAQGKFDILQTEAARERVEQLSREVSKKQTILNLTEDELATLEAINAQARTDGANMVDAKERDKAARAKLSAEKKLSRRQALVGKAGSTIGRADGVWLEATSLTGIPKEFREQISDYEDKLDALKIKHNELSTSPGPIKDEDKKALIEQAKEVDLLTEKISGLVNEYQRLSGDNVEELGLTALGPTNSLNEYKQQLIGAVNAATNGKAQIKGFDNETKTLTYTVKTGAHEITEYAAAVRNLDHQLVSVKGNTKRTETFFEATKRKMGEISSYVTGMTILSRAKQELQRGIQYIREIDQAMTELRKVTNETEKTYDKFLDTAAKTGKRLGSTISQVTLATATFAKLGYNMEMATEMAEAALVYKNVGDGIESADDAADSIISTLKGFRMEASEAMAIVDRFNEVGNKFAITSKGIGEALRLSASALSEGGNNLDESISLITAANEVINDPSSVGTALKTLTLRLRGAKTELSEAGLDIEDMATTTSQLQAKLLALTGGKVDIMADANTFKNSTQILREMADAWQYMTDVQRASALELMGGKRQANVLSALIQNFDTVESVIKTSEGSAGSALRENEVFLNSIEGRIQQFTNTVQTKWSEALDTDVIKDAIQLFTKLIDTLDFEDSALIDLVGGLIKALSWLIDLVGDNNFGYTLIAFFSAKAINKNGWLDFLESWFNKSKETIGDLTEEIKNLYDENASLAEKEAKRTGKEQTDAIKQIEKNEELIASKKAKLQQKINDTEVDVNKRSDKLSKQGLTPDEIEADPKIKQWTKEIKEGKEALGEYNAKVKEVDDTLNSASDTTTKSAAATETQNMVTAENSAETATNSSQQAANDGAQGANATARVANDATIDEQNRDLATQNGLLEENSVEQNKNAAANKTSAASLSSGFKSFLKGFATMIIIQSALQAIDGIMNLIAGDGEDVADTFEEIHDEFERESDALQQEKSELKDIESELDDINSQITEIKSLGELSFTKQEELNNLEKQREELERMAEIQGIIAQNQQKKTNEAALTAAKSYMDQAAGLDESREEFIKKETENVTKWTNTIGDALTAVGGIVAMAAGWTGVGAAVGAGIAAVGQLTKIGGEHIAKNNAEANYEKQQTNQEAVNNYAKKRAEYQKKLDDAFAKSDAEEYNKIKEEYEKFEVMMSDNIGGLISYLNSVDYKTLSKTKKEEFEAFQRIVNQYSLENGGSLANVINSILSYDRYQNTGYQMKDIQNKLKRGEITEEEATTQIKSLISPELLAEFTALNQDLTIDDIVNSYVQLGVELQNTASVVDSLDKVSKVTNAFDSLGSAIKEFREEGSVAVGTLESLNETFGGLDEFEELYKVLATGEGDLESAITNVANAYVGQAGILADMTDEELAVMATRLKSIGVMNAEEVLMARQTGQEKLDAQLKKAKAAYSIDLSMYGTAEQAKLAIAQAAGLNIAEIQGDTIEELENAYGKDLSAYASVEAAKIAIAQERAKAEAETNRANLKQQYDNKQISETEYLAGLDSINNSLNFAANSSTIQSIIDNAFKDFKFNYDGQIGIGSDFDEALGDSEEVKEAKSEWEKLVSKYENQLALITNERDLIEAEIDKAEARGGKASVKYYEDLIRTSTEEKTLLEQQYTAMKRYLDANADTIDQDTWTDYNNSLNEIAVSIKECETNTIQWQEALREIDIHYFNQATDEISRLGKELEFVDSLLADEDVADENGNWSSAALTRMAMYMSQIEAAAADTQRYQDELAKLEGQYAAGELSEEQYQERLATLTDGLYDSINAQNDARDSIIELNEARVESIKEGIEKEIEAYEDLIDAKREQLDAERDLYEFRKDTQKQTKDIASLERRIAALSGSSAASDIAERRKLEEQLQDAKSNLNDSYYSHSRDAQSKALDDEAEAYNKSKEKYIERLEEQLEDTETLIQNSMMDVLFNADTVYNELNGMADIYGDILSDELIEPWSKAAEQATTWKNELEGDLTSLTGEGGAITIFANGVSEKLSGSWDTVKSAVESYSDFLTGSELGSNFSNTITGFANQIQKIVDKWTGVKNAADAAYKAQITANSVGGKDNSGSGSGSGYTQYTAPKKYYSTATYNTGTKVLTATGVGDTKEQAETNAMTRLSSAYFDYMISIGTHEDKVSGMWNTNKRKAQIHTDYYAKGTTGIPNDQLAVVDELGPELILHADPITGRLQYLTKGSGVIPTQLTANLMEWGQFTPDSLNLGGGVNVNMINNAVNKPEFNFVFDALVKAENITEETLPAVKKLVTQELNRFTKELNYALKGKGAR